MNTACLPLRLLLSLAFLAPAACQQAYVGKSPTESVSKHATADQHFPCQAEGAFDADAAAAPVLSRQAALAACLSHTEGAFESEPAELAVLLAVEPNETAIDGFQRSSSWSTSFQPVNETKGCIDKVLRTLQEQHEALRPAGEGALRCQFLLSASDLAGSTVGESTGE